MIEEFITTIFKPSTHPVKSLARKHQERYLYGVGEILHSLDSNNIDAHFAFDCLCENLLGESIDEAWNHSSEMPHARKAQKLMCKGFLKFYRFTDCFWWDVYHIASISGIPQQNANQDNLFKKITTSKGEQLRKAALDLFYNHGDGVGLNKSLLDISSIERDFKSKPIRKYLVVGTMSAGKSSLINALVGKKVAQVKTTVCTTRLTHFVNQQVDEGYIIYSDGKKYILASTPKKDNEGYSFVSIKFNGALANKRIIITDTPGVDYAYDESHRQLTSAALKAGDYDVVLCVVNASYVESDGEASMIDMVLSATTKKKIFILNQLDRFDPEDDSIEESVERFKSFLKRKNVSAEVVPFSAKLAYSQKTKGTEKNSEPDWLLKHFQDRFYDLGYYGSGYESKENDLYARSGLANLESIIANQ